MDSRIIEVAIDIAKTVAKAHKEHYQLDVAVAQRNDDLGVGLHVQLGAALPRNTILIGWLKGLYLGKLPAVDESLFRDTSGDFFTYGPVNGQIGALYIPYGAAQNRGPGLYTLEIRVHVTDPRTATSAEVGKASYKLALPPQPAWRRVEFFWPLIKLCMAVVRVDDEVLPIEIRRLREYLTNSLSLRPDDMPDLHAVLKDPHYGDLGHLLDSLSLRLPLLTPDALVQILCEVARLDGPVNAHEFSLIRQVAKLLSVPPERCAELAATPSPSTALVDPRATPG